MFKSAVLCHSSGSILDANRIYSEILAIDSKNFGALHNQGLIYFQTGNLYIAEYNISMAVDINPGSAIALKNLGLIFNKAGRYKEAAFCLEKSVRVNGYCYESMCHLGFALYKQKYYYKAIEVFETIISKLPSDKITACNLCLIYSQIGLFQNAVEYCKLAFELDCLFPSTWLDLLKTLHTCSKIGTQVSLTQREELYEILSNLDIIQPIENYCMKLVVDTSSSDSNNHLTISQGCIDQYYYSFISDKKEKLVLYIDFKVPETDTDSGSVDAFNYMKALHESGYKVHFYGWNTRIRRGHYSEALESIGITCLYSPFVSSLEDWLSLYGPSLFAVFISREWLMGLCIDMVKKHAKNAAIIFNTVDLHFLRHQRWAQHIGSQDQLNEAMEVRKRELSHVSTANATMVVSEVEEQLLNSLIPDAKVYQIPIIRFVPGSDTSYEDRDGIAFLGMYAHNPNEDAVLYFVSDIFPIIKERVPELKLHLYGSNMKTSISNLASSDIIVHGFVSDLGTAFNKRRLSIAPLRYGAGQKGKIVTSLSYGVPVVATSMATEGMHLTNEINVLVEDTPERFACAVINLYRTKALWESLSEAGLQHVKKHFEFSAVKNKLNEMLNDVLAIDANLYFNFRLTAEQLLNSYLYTDRIELVKLFSKSSCLSIAELAYEYGSQSENLPFRLIRQLIEENDCWILKLSACIIAVNQKSFNIACALAEMAFAQNRSDCFAEGLWHYSRTLVLCSTTPVLAHNHQATFNLNDINNIATLTEKELWINSCNFLEDMDANNNRFYQSLISEIEHAIALKTEGHVTRICASITINSRNYYNTVRLVEIFTLTGVDYIKLSMVSIKECNDGNEFSRLFVGSFNHPSYRDFIAMLNLPIFKNDAIDIKDFCCYIKE